MTSPLVGLGGLPPRRPDQQYRPGGQGVSPGPRSIERVRSLIIQGPGGGEFIYNAAGNLIFSNTGAATTDPNYKLPVPQGAAFYDGLTHVGNVLILLNQGKITTGLTGGPQVVVDTTLNIPLATVMPDTGAAAADVASITNITNAVRMPTGLAGEANPCIIAPVQITYNDASVADALLVLDGLSVATGGALAPFELHVAQSNALSNQNGIITGIYTLAAGTITLRPRFCRGVTGGIDIGYTGSVFSVQHPGNGNLIPAVESWQGMAARGYQNGWTDSGNSPAGRWRLMPWNAVRLEGSLNTPAAPPDGQVVLNVPLAYHPQNAYPNFSGRCIVPSNAAVQVRFNILANGNLTIAGASGLAVNTEVVIPAMCEYPTD